MWILIAEMLLALGVIVFIMWWTLKARVDHPVRSPETEKPKEDLDRRVADGRDEEGGSQ